MHSYGTFHSVILHNLDSSKTLEYLVVSETSKYVEQSNDEDTNKYCLGQN